MSKLSKKKIWTDDGVKEVAFKNNKLYNYNNMKKVSLSLKERHLLFGILATWKGGMDEMPFISDDIKAANITEEDWAKAERTRFIAVKNKADGVEGLIAEKEFNKETMETTGKDGYWTWKEDKIKPIEISISPASVKYLKKILDDKSDKGEITLKDGEIIDLLKKLS